MKAIYWVIGVSIAGLILFGYVLIGDTQKSVPKIQLSYFVDEKEIAESIERRLSQEISRSQSFWIGVEPEKNEQLEVAYQLEKVLQKTKNFKTVIIDAELNLSKEWIEKFQTVETISVKDSISTLAGLLSDLEKQKLSYLLITASIYSTPLIKLNQLHQIKNLKPIQPMTFSFAYFPTNADNESNMTFACSTEDHSGTAEWGCMVANKARFIRRRINADNSKPWIGAMDLIGETDYMILLFRK